MPSAQPAGTLPALSVTPGAARHGSPTLFQRSWNEIEPFGAPFGVPEQFQVNVEIVELRVQDIFQAEQISRRAANLHAARHIDLCGKTLQALQRVDTEPG